MNGERNRKEVADGGGGGAGARKLEVARKRVIQIESMWNKKAHRTLLNSDCNSKMKLI